MKKSEAYKSNLESVLSGQLQESSSIARQNREATSRDLEIERLLISSRLALKAGNLAFDLSLLDIGSTQDTFLKAEILFVRGLFLLNLQKPVDAEKSFEECMPLYLAMGENKKFALAWFNSLIAKSEQIDSTSESESGIESQLNQLGEFTQTNSLLFVQFLVDRQLSYLAFQKNDFGRSKNLLIKWVGRSDVITKSDSQLGLIHLADCCFSMSDLAGAIQFLSQITGDLDERVLFPQAYMFAKIYNRDLQIESYSIVNTHWKSRAEKFLKAQMTTQVPKSTLQGLRWCHKTGYLTEGKRLIAKVKSQSLEGQLLRALWKGPQSKIYLCEILWPEALESLFLDDRFHQIMKRLNQKLNKRIHFDGALYSLRK